MTYQSGKQQRCIGDQIAKGEGLPICDPNICDLFSGFLCAHLDTQLIVENGDELRTDQVGQKKPAC